MVFTSFVFIVFFIIAIVTYYVVPYKFRWVQLLICSYVFYGYWKIEYLSLIVASTLIDYLCGLAMQNRDTKTRRKPFLYISLFVNLTMLFVFKYYNFFYDSFIDVFNISEAYARAHRLDILLPVGISFYTFQTLSYTIDVYYGKIEPTRHLGKFATYVAFFPQLVAGPIERASSLLPQFEKKVKLDYQQIADGLKLMAWGFFKKIVIADRLMRFVEYSYSDALKNHALDQFFVFILGIFMVYADFSAYTDIARGAAKTLGFNLIENFKQPLFSKTISEFWSKWHISMTTWFGDYLYKPLLVFKTDKRWKNYAGIFILFLVIGFWHGASWTFGIWGSLFAMMMIFANITKRYRNYVWKIIHKFIIKDSKWYNIFRNSFDYLTVYLLIACTSPFFFSDSVLEAMKFYYSLLHFNPSYEIALTSSIFDLIIICTTTLLMLFVDYVEKIKGKSIIAMVNQQKLIVRMVIYILTIFSIFNFGDFGVKDFVYFQF
jgi:alginate O-acetyltransferase complex protein AlgI